MSYDAASASSVVSSAPQPLQPAAQLVRKCVVDDCDTIPGPRPRVPGQETRVLQMTERPAAVAAHATAAATNAGVINAAAAATQNDGGSTAAAAASAAASATAPTTSSASFNHSSSITSSSSLPTLDSASNSNINPTNTSSGAVPLHKQHQTSHEHQSSTTLPNATATSTSGHQQTTAASAPPTAPTLILTDWHQNLIKLLDDAAGAKAFKDFAEQQGGLHIDRLNFYFACEGLKQQSDDAKIKQMVAAIYKFLRKSKIPLGNELRARIKNGLAAGAPPIDPNIFNAMQEETVHTIGDQTYPHFLSSDQYIEYVNEMASMPPASNSSSATASRTQAAAKSSAAAAPLNPTIASPYGSGNAATAAAPRALMTLHEDSVLSASACEPAASFMPLTLNSLLVSECQRLDVRPNGAHGYVGQFSSAYNPVSLQNSECMSVSSGGGMKMDSDGGGGRHRSSREGRSDHYRRSEVHSSHSRSSSHQHYPHEQPAQHLQQHDKHINQNTNLAVPMNSSMRGPNVNKMTVLSPEDFKKILLPKLEAIKHQQDHGLPRTLKPAHGQLLVNADSFTEALSFAEEDDNDQSILDKHVSRVWDISPARSPGTKSPYPLAASLAAADGAFGGPGGGVRSRQLSGHGAASAPMMAGGLGGAAGAIVGSGSMRHARPSMPGSATNTSSRKMPSSASASAGGMYSMESSSMAKSRMDSTSSRSRTMGGEMTSSNNTLEEARRRLEDETGRLSRHYPHYSKDVMHHPVGASGSGLSSAATVPSAAHGTVVALYEFYDSPVPYRYTLSGQRPTLKQYKDNLPTKGHYRFFFKTACDDPDSPVIKVEVVNDSDILPLFEGKVMGEIKPYE